MSSAAVCALPAAAPPFVAPINYVAACQAAGFLLFNIERGCWPDVFAAYDRLHSALALPMTWGAFRSTNDSPLSLTHHVGRILRAISEADILAAIASADREFRRARFQYAELLANDIRHLDAKLTTGRYADNATGAADRAADASRLAALTRTVETHRRALAVRR